MAVTIVDGSARLNIWPFGWLSDAWKSTREQQMMAVVRALASAHPHVMSVTVSYGNPGVRVEVAVPADGSLDLHALHADLTRRATDALRRSSKVRTGDEPEEAA